MFLGQRFLLAMLLASLGSATAGATDPPPSAPPNIILITLDTTRADRMGFLGCRRGLTPNLDSLARQSLLFENAYAQVPLTTPSHATILTGTYPQFNHLSELGTPIAKDLPYLPDILHQHHYTTAAFVGSQVLDPASAAAPGFDRGFDTYDAGFHSRRPGESRYASEERRAAKVVNRALSWLGEHPARPVFLWVHLYDPHDPYDPPEPFKTRYAAVPYDGEIAYVDSALGTLLSALKLRGLYDRSVIAVVADHGEAFGEHGEESHGFFLYDETIHVPLLIKLPAARVGPVRVNRRVGLVDVSPTLLVAVGVETPSSMQGSSLLEPPARGEAKWDAVRESDATPSYAETDYPRRAFGWSSLRAWRQGKFLYVDAPRRELYDQDADPKSLHNLADSSPGVADTMQAQLDAFRRKTSNDAMARQTRLSPQQAEQLQALGYATSESAELGPESVRGPDPKDKIEVANLLHRGLLEMDNERYREAIPHLQAVLKEEPNLALGNLELGRALNGIGNYSEALPPLRRAVKLSPESGRSHFELGVALGETGDWAGSAEQLELAVTRAPDSDDLRFYLGMAYDAMGSSQEAEKNFRAALHLNPNHYRANLMLGRLLGMENQPAQALPFLRKAVELQPRSPDGHKFLANIYIELGQEDNARREQSEAARLQKLSNP
jgi:arylsulfatase A-like enzyme/Tfp pilus assembly protein PilF